MFVLYTSRPLCQDYGALRFGTYDLGLMIKNVGKTSIEV